MDARDLVIRVVDETDGTREQRLIALLALAFERYLAMEDAAAVDYGPVESVYADVPVESEVQPW